MDILRMFTNTIHLWSVIIDYTYLACCVLSKKVN